jgi:hypothetical protein
MVKLSPVDHKSNQFVKEYVGFLAEAVANEKNEDFLIEVVGTLANLNLSDIDYKLVLEEYNLISWIKSKLDSCKFLACSKQLEAIITDFETFYLLH